jgi:hypothetical protein
VSDLASSLGREGGGGGGEGRRRRTILFNNTIEGPTGVPAVKPGLSTGHSSMTTVRAAALGQIPEMRFYSQTSFPMRFYSQISFPE